jgi:mono/diheme cytochrome c family protein
MRRNIQLSLALAMAVSLAGVLSHAQSSGEATYKAKCSMCHGDKGAADTPVAKAFKMRPLSDPAVRDQSEAKMVDAVVAGNGRMPPFKDKLTYAEIKAAVDYFRNLK